MIESRESITRKKDRLDRLPMSPEVLRNLEHYYDLEITYTSNAIEGNMLTAVETTLVIEKGITITGRPLKDHLEMLDHYDAIRYVRALASENGLLIENDLRNLHRLTMQRSRPNIAGRYADLAPYIRTRRDASSFHRQQKFRPARASRWRSAATFRHDLPAAHMGLVSADEASAWKDRIRYHADDRNAEARLASPRSV